MTQSPIKPSLSAQLPCPFDDEKCHYPCDKLVIGKCAAGLSDKDTYLQLGVSRSTWFRYRNGQHKPPRSVCFFLHTMSGNLPWTGFQNCFINQREQKLYIDEYKYGITLHDLQSYWWQLQELRMYRRQRSDELQQTPESTPEVIPLSVVS